jgi:hypothetical protein
MSTILIIGARIDRLANARRALRQCSGLRARAARSSPRTSSADCITSISTRHNGRHFCALQESSGDRSSLPDVTAKSNKPSSPVAATATPSPASQYGADDANHQTIDLLRSKSADRHCSGMAAGAGAAAPTTAGADKGSLRSTRPSA